MTDKLRPGDRVRGPDGRTGVICEIFSEVLAWVSWENDRPSYESVESLSKMTRFVECQTPSKPARQPRKKVANDHPRYPQSQWPRARMLYTLDKSLAGLPDSAAGR